MKLSLLTSIFALVFVPTFAQIPCPANNIWEEGCEEKVNICQITCKSGADCENHCGPESGLESEPTGSHADMTADVCQTLCEKSRDSEKPEVDVEHRCRFWRSDKVENDEKHCTLLNKDQCEKFRHCAPRDCKCGDVGCSKDTPPDDAQPCKGDIVFNPPSSTTTFIRWACEPANPYSEATVPAGTVCATTHKCWKWRDPSNDVPDKSGGVRQVLRLKCKGATGLWEPEILGTFPVFMQNYYDKAVANGDGSDALQELECEPRVTDALSVDPQKTHGLINCENEITIEDNGKYLIKAPNTCILLCDFHLGMTIKGMLNDQGDYAFYKVETSEEITQDNVDDQIKCW